MLTKNICDKLDLLITPGTTVDVLGYPEFYRDRINNKWYDNYSILIPVSKSYSTLWQLVQEIHRVQHK